MSESAGLTSTISNSYIEGNVTIKDNHVHVYVVEEKKYIPLHEFLANSQHLPPALPHYYELHLAERDMRPRDDRKDERIPHEVRRHLYLDPKRKTERWYNPQPASQRLASISNNPTKAVHVILGEPGGGKTTLLSQWAHDAYDNYQANPSSASFPIYMRLRELHKYEEKSQSKNETLQYYYQQRKTKFFDLMPFIQGKAKALWFFDGLDELPEEARAHWAEYIDDVAGQKIVSCRVLRYQQDFARFGTRQEYLIYGLNRQQQSEYLQKILPSLQENPDHAHADSAWINTLLNKLHQQEHSNLRQLAISPLLLKLIAETNPPNAIKLPNTRSDFYDAAISSMLKREQRLEKLGRLTERKLKNALAEIAYHAGLEFNFSAEVLTDGLEHLCGEDDTKAKQLEDDFINCGILRQVGDSYEFLHATFHEWALAHYLARQDNPLVNTVKNYWRDPRYDEVIVLLWTHDKVDDRQREEATLFLMGAECQEQVGNTQRRRSGLKQSIVFWDIAGMQMKDTLAAELWQRIGHVPEIRYALAYLNTRNRFFLLQLSQDDNEIIRRLTASNNFSPLKALERLLNDSKWQIRAKVAKNPKLPYKLMEAIALNDIKEVRHSLTLNSNLPLNVILILSQDESQLVRASLGENAKLSHAIMKKLFQSEDLYIHIGLASNSSLSSALSKLLAQHSLAYIRWKLASNPNLSKESFNILSSDSNSYVQKTLFYTEHKPPTPRIVLRSKILTEPKTLKEVRDLKELFQGIPSDYTNSQLTFSFNLSKANINPYDITTSPKSLQKLVNNIDIAQHEIKEIIAEGNIEVTSCLATNPNVCWEIFLNTP